MTTETSKTIKTILITAALLIIAAASYHIYTNVTATHTAKVLTQEATQKTDSIKKEVQTNAKENTELRKHNDADTERNIKSAVDAVPDDIDALIHSANAIIRGSHQNRRTDSTDVTN